MIKRCTRKTESGVIWLLAFLPRAKARGFPALDSDEEHREVKETRVIACRKVNIELKYHINSWKVLGTVNIKSDVRRPTSQTLHCVISMLM